MASRSKCKVWITICTFGVFSLGAVFLLSLQELDPARKANVSPLLWVSSGPRLCGEWWPETPARDRRGNLLWADFPDNFLVLLVTRCPGRPYSYLPGVTETRFTLPDEKRAVVQRGANELVVFDPNGSKMCSVPLNAGQAESFFKKVKLQEDHGLLDDLLIPLASLLTPMDINKVRDDGPANGTERRAGDARKRIETGNQSVILDQQQGKR